MNTLDDDLRTVLRRQADAMQVPTPIEILPLARVTPVSPTVERRWLLPAAAVVLVVVGGLALAQRRSSDAPAASSSEQPGSSAALSFETPTVRLSADKIEFGVGDSVFTPTSFTVNSDPGNAESTSLELSWIVGDTEQGINMHFASDGVSWWADGIRTYDAAGEAPDSHEGQRWFTSPLGTAWSGDLNLPNLRITNMTVEAFMRPASCDNPTSPIAVVAAYPTIDGVAGEGLGFRGRIDLIGTATCTPVDASPYTFTAIVDDPSIAAIIGINELLPTATTIPGGQPDGAEAASEQFGSFELRFLKPGQTTLRVTVTDSAGTVIGTTSTPITLRAASVSESASTAVPGDSTAVTTTGVITLAPSQTVDARDEAWRAAVYEEMASFGTCAIADRTAGSDVLFVSRVTCNHFSDGQPVDGNLVFDLSKLPANVDTNLAGWQQGVAGFDTPGEQVGGNAEMFVETSGGTVRRVAIVTPTHVIRIIPELVESEYLPSGDALAVAAQHLNLLADSILAKQ